MGDDEIADGDAVVEALDGVQGRGADLVEAPALQAQERAVLEREMQATP